MLRGWGLGFRLGVRVDGFPPPLPSLPSLLPSLLSLMAPLLSLALCLSLAPLRQPFSVVAIPSASIPRFKIFLLSSKMSPSVQTGTLRYFACTKHSRVLFIPDCLCMLRLCISDYLYLPVLTEGFVACTHTHTLCARTICICKDKYALVYVVYPSGICIGAARAPR